MDAGAHTGWLADQRAVQSHAGWLQRFSRHDAEGAGLMARFTGKVAIVTRASTGLGPIMSKMLADEGAKVVLAARRTELVEAAAKEIGENAIALRADVTNEDDVAAMVDAAMQRWGQVDIMMNNAAAPGQDKYIWEQTLENWNATFPIDVTAAMR